MGGIQCAILIPFRQMFVAKNTVKHKQKAQLTREIALKRGPEVTDCGKRENLNL